MPRPNRPHCCGSSSMASRQRKRHSPTIWPLDARWTTLLSVWPLPAQLQQATSRHCLPKLTRSGKANLWRCYHAHPACDRRQSIAMGTRLKYGAPRDGITSKIKRLIRKRIAISGGWHTIRDTNTRKNSAGSVPERRFVALSFGEFHDTK
jgi:hypothetical protein